MCCIIKKTLPKTNSLSPHYYTSSYKDIKHSLNLGIEDYNLIIGVSLSKIAIVFIVVPNYAS